MLAFPDGMYIGTNWAPYWFIGQKQDFANVYVMALILSALFLKHGMYRIRVIVLCAVMGVTVAYAFSAGLAFFSILFVSMLVLVPQKVKKNLNPYVLLSICAIANLAMVWLAYNYQDMKEIQEMLMGIASTGMSKDKTILSRTMIWQDAMELFAKKPILGNGVISEDRWHTIQFVATKYHPHFHNIVFDLLATGGIISLSLFAAINFLAAKKLKHGMNTKTGYTLATCVFCMNIHMLIECYYAPQYWIIYLLAFSWEHVAEDFNRKADK